MEDLLWRKKSRQRGRYLMLFLIRLAETLTVSLLPSVVGLIAVFITPKPRVMQTIELVSLLVFAVANCFFWTRYVFHRANLREFFVLNGIVYLLYVAISAFAYMSSDAYLYSILFSNMRGLEIFGYRTIESLYKAHFLVFGLMVATGIIARLVCFQRLKKAMADGVEKAEIEEKESVPEQDNKVVEFLTVDEVNLELDREMKEAAEMIRMETENVSDKNWDSAMVQGDNGEIIETTPVDPENDIDSRDYVSEEYAREEMSVTLNYDVDSLWNSDIYQGKEKTTDYDDEVYVPQMFVDENIDGLWNRDMYRGRGEDIGFGEEPEPELFTGDDESDGLWNQDMYRGRDESNGIAYEEEEERYIEWDDGSDEEEPLFRLEYYDEPEEYFAAGMEDYDTESLWSDFTQGQ